MVEVVREELLRKPNEHALCSAMRNGFLKLHASGREVESLRTEDSITTTMSSWPYDIWMEAQGRYTMSGQDSNLFRQEFILSIKTVNEHAQMALENVPFEDCPRCSKRYAGKLCIFHAIPPQEFIRCFCLAHPDVRCSDYPIHPDLEGSDCPTHCKKWELAKGEISSFLPSVEKSNLAIDGVYSCMAKIIFRRHAHPSRLCDDDPNYLGFG